MSAELPFDDERRRHARSEVVATTVVFSRDKMHGTFFVQDLSAGGACLLGHLDAHPGDRITLLLRFPGKAPFSVEARVVRHEPRTSVQDDHTAVSFLGLLAEQEDIIHEAIVAALERETARLAATILVIDPDDATREALENDLRALGHQPLAVSTPLEALSWLERPGARISTVFVDMTPGSSNGLDVLDFLGEHHPDIRRVVMAGETRPFRLDLALRSGRAHQVLKKPWDRRRLAEAVAAARAPTDVTR